MFAVAVAVPGVAAAQRTYKWIDSQGNVSYHDRPPPADSGYRVEERQLKQRQSGDADPAAATGAPVVLYMVPKCASCDLVRAHLQRRKVPFTEKNVEKDVKLQDELKTKVGALTVPAITVGSKVLNSYAEGWLDSELDQAGYPKVEAGATAEKAPEETGYKAPTQ
jgi:glutaredoxin